MAMISRKDALVRLALAGVAAGTRPQPSLPGPSSELNEGGGWIHPAGFLDVATIKEMRRKVASLEWAHAVVKDLDAGIQPWLAQPLERIEALLPKRKMQVYWLMTCPNCGERLPFDPFNAKDVTCLKCHKTFTLDHPSPATYAPYAGTLYEGWGCSYLMAASTQAESLALLHALGSDRAYAERSAAIVKLFAKYIRPLPVKGGGTQRVIWTYNMEGDWVILQSLITAYELLRGVPGLFGADEHRAIQLDLVKHWTDAVFRVEKESSQNHNNMYGYLSVVALAGCAIEDADYVDWAFGRRAYSEEKLPAHRSLAWLTEHNYRPDGGFWGLCSAYHLYALSPNCKAFVLGHRLARQMPGLLPPAVYDDAHPSNPRSRVLRRAIKWFTAQAFPDLTMAPFGDMGGRVSLASYALTAEIGYRYLGTDEAGSYRTLREGNRGLTGLVYGVDSIKEKPVPYRSANLSSGYAALKREANGNRLYAGLNALQPGEMHQHGDRLNLLTYSRDRMLTGEKPTRYEDEGQREYSGASYSHNTVTVDETSQVHGSQLTGDRVPHIDTFIDLPAAQVAEAHGDRVYEQTRLYRRLLCQFDDYLLDIFHVEGGKVHDWFFHGVGQEPIVTIPTVRKSEFEPATYVARGKPEFKVGAADRSFSATWRLPPEPGSEFAGRRREVFSRVTVAGVPGQTAYVLSTYPDPGEHSLMVRHAGASAPFVAVHEAYFAEPVVRVRTLEAPASSAATPAIEITHQDGSRRLAVYNWRGGPLPLGESAVGDRLELTGRFATVEFDPRGRLRSLLLVRGTELRCPSVQLRADGDVSLSVTCHSRRARFVSSPPIGYETLEGVPVFRAADKPKGDAVISLSVAAAASPTGKEIRDRRVTLAGQTTAGPVHVDMPW
jgi:hypothetical protein